MENNDGIIQTMLLDLVGCFEGIPLQVFEIERLPMPRKRRHKTSVYH
jgi:hypothetical protein